MSRLKIPAAPACDVIGLSIADVTLLMATRGDTNDAIRPPFQGGFVLAVMSSRPRSANEYGMGYRVQVAPLLPPESPPPAPPSAVHFRRGGCSSVMLMSPAFRQMGHSLDCDLPQRVAEKFKDLGPTDTLTIGDDEGSARPLLRSPTMIPTISIDGDAGGAGLHEVPPRRRPSLASMASFCPSEVSNNSFNASLDKPNFASSRIQWLVNAFTGRAKVVKERIAQPPTPSSSSASSGSSPERREAPKPPPINLRDDQPDETAVRQPEIGFFQRIPKTFHPQSLSYIGWLSVVTTAFFYNLWCVPLRACFPYQDPDNVYHWFLGDYMADAIYLLDTLLVRPRLRFVRDGIWIQDVSECRKIYMRTLGCKVDVLSLLPMDLLYFYYGPDFPLLRIPRMIRILPFWELFDRLDVVVANPFIIRISRTLSYLLYLIHLNACAYYLFSEAAGIGADSFVFQGDGNAYIRCFYFALKTATKIGKNPKPVNHIDRTFMVFNWLIGVFACAAIIGQMRDIMAAADKSVNEYRDRVDRVVAVMNRLHLPVNLQNRVRMWFSYSWSTQKTLDETSSLVTLSHNMQLDIALNVHFQTLSKVQLFQDCDQGLLRDLVLKLRPVLFLPGDLVCKKGEVGKEMYIVKSGQVQVMGGLDNNTVLVTLSEGSVFGEISLLAVGGGNRRMADVKSKGFSNLFVLSKNDLNEALIAHPEAQKILQHKAKKLVKKSSKRQLSEVAAQPILTPQKKVTTPKLVKAVLQAVTPDSKASQFLRRGSRSPNPQPTEHSQPPMEGRASSAPDELLLRPDQLSEEANKRPKLSRTRMLCPSFSNRINPTNDDLTPRAHSD